jgi:ribokinase
MSDFHILWTSQDGSVTVAPGRRGPVVDVTGAGDAFAAGLLAAWTAGAPAAVALNRAGELGATAVALVDARPPGPG